MDMSWRMEAYGGIWAFWKSEAIYSGSMYTRSKGRCWRAVLLAWNTTISRCIIHHVAVEEVYYGTKSFDYASNYTEPFVRPKVSQGEAL